MSSQSVEAQGPVRFGDDFELDMRVRRLRRGNRVVKLERIPLEILVLLVNHPGEIVTRDQVVSTVWGNDVFFDTDNSIRGAIRKIRQALRDDSEDPRFIQTITGRGYRFIAPVTTAEEKGVNGEKSRLEALGVAAETDSPTDKPMPAEAAQGPEIKRISRWLVLSLAAGVALLAVTYSLMRSHPSIVSAPNIQSVAVLPLKNLSGDSTQEYFADGMTEAVIGQLATIHGLRVISRTTAMHFKDSRNSVPEIAKMLHVDGIVEGSVIRDGSRVRVHAQFIRGATDEHIWSETYDRDLRDVLTIQSDIARVIANEVQLTLHTPEVGNHLPTRPVDRAAYEDYLKGQYFVRKDTQADWKKGVDYLESAIQKDPTYAPPYSALADFYLFRGGDEQPLFDPSESFADRVTRKAEPFARKAIALDENLSEGHVSLANIYLHQYWDWSAAEREIKRALELSSSNAKAHATYSTYLAVMGRLNEALRENDQELQLSPLDAVAQAEVGDALRNVGRDQDALVAYQKAVELDPMLAYTHEMLARAYEKDGAYDKSISELALSIELDPNSTHADAEFLRRGYRTAGFHAAKKALWNRLLERARQDLRQGRPVAGALADLCAQLGDKDGAFYWLDKASVQDRYMMVYLKLDPKYELLRSDPRYQAVLQRAGIPF
jgi:TolB-like protein/DNA-binding winged helix-turn-helix (wHTH) protein/Tfp pilus assembly protein PilF